MVATLTTNALRKQLRDAELFGCQIALIEEQGIALAKYDDECIMMAVQQGKKWIVHYHNTERITWKEDEE